MAVLLLIVAVLTVIPACAYHLATRRWSNQWTFFEKKHSAIGGAYRGGWVWEQHNPGAPKLVKVASIWSLGLIVPALVSFPLILIGIAQESDNGIGPAAVFGPTGFILAVTIFISGVSLLRRRARARHLARVVGFWAILHNIAVVYMVVMASTMDQDSHAAWSDFSFSGFGRAALAYAAVSFAHAFTLLAAAQKHELVSKVDRVEPDVATGEAPVYAST